MPREFLFDPRKMIAGPWHRCPNCGAEELGTLEISDYAIARRCRRCLHTPLSEPLPPVSKKVVYLDQLVLSEIAKALDPVWREEQPGDRDFWLRLFDALDRVVKLQLVVCPESRVHEEESVVHRHYVVLRRLYQHFAAGTSFEFSTRVHALQLGHALSMRLDGRPVDYASIDRTEIIEGSLDGWVPRLQIHVDFPGYPDPVLLNRVRENSGRAFREIFERWARERRSFEEVYREERLGHVQTMLILLREYMGALEAVWSGRAPVSEAIWNPRLEVDTVLGLVAFAESRGMERMRAAEYVVEFLASEDALTAPANEISSLLMAGLARRAAAGQREPPSRGMWNDFTVISAFLPYSDAMFLDNQCASLLREEPIRTWIARYPTRIFSARTRDDFVAYLRELEDAAGPERAELVTSIYGEKWLRPFRELLEHEREREQRRRTEAEGNSAG